MNKNKDDKYVQISTYILDFLIHGPFRNVHYVARLEFLKNFKNEEYVKRIVDRTGVDKYTLRENSRLYIRDLRVNLISKLKSMEFMDMVRMINDQDHMDDFLRSINKGIGEVKDDIFLQERN